MGTPDRGTVPEKRTSKSSLPHMLPTRDQLERELAEVFGTARPSWDDWDKPPGDVSWQEQALCRGVDEESFFDPDQFEEAIALCGTCPVRKECLEYAYKSASGRGYGVWGGTIPEDRKQVKSQGRGFGASIQVLYERSDRRVKGQRYCKRCGFWKDSEEFTSRKMMVAGPASFCKLCHSRVGLGRKPSANA